MEPVSWSRNWDADEVFEDPQDFPPPSFHWEAGNTATEKYHCKVLLVGTKGAGAAFLEACFPDIKKIGTLQLPVEDKYINHFGMYIPSSNKDVVLVINQYNVQSDRVHDWTTTLFEYINTEQVFIFDTLVESFYHNLSGSKPVPPLLRKLQTSSYKAVDTIVFLEIPNMIERVSAAILVYCEMRQISACAFISLYEMRFITTHTLIAFEEAAKVVPISLPPTTDFYTKAVTALNKHADNGMYI